MRCTRLKKTWEIVRLMGVWPATHARMEESKEGLLGKRSTKVECRLRWMQPERSPWLSTWWGVMCEV